MERSGKERIGRDRSGRDRIGADGMGEERNGEERTGAERKAADRKGYFFKGGCEMKRVRFTVEGVTPHLVNKFTDAAAMNATEGTRGSHIGQSLTPREDAETRLNVNERGEPIAPSPALLCMLIDAGRFHKVGKNKVSTQKSSLIPAAVTFPEVYFLLVSEGAGRWTRGRCASPPRAGASSGTAPALMTGGSRSK
jgi:hypothetical protein